MNNPSTELTFIPSLCLVIWPFCGFAYWMPRLSLLLSSTRSHLHKKWQGRWSQERIIHGPMHDKVCAPQDERRRNWGERGGGKRKCQGALKPQSPRQLPGLNHLRSSLTSGIDRHARYDLVPAAPPPPTSSSFIWSSTDFFISCFQLNSLALVILNKSCLLSLTHSKYIYTHPHAAQTLFLLWLCFWMCVIGAWMTLPPQNILIGHVCKQRAWSVCFGLSFDMLNFRSESGFESWEREFQRCVSRLHLLSIFPPSSPVSLPRWWVFD